MELIGLVFMVVGGLLALSAIRSYALYRATRRNPAARAASESWKRLLLGMLVASAVLIAAGYLVAQ